MIVRLWRTELNDGCKAEYRAFEEEHSLPMFREQKGFLGVLFLRDKEGAAALTFWENAEAVTRLAESATYRATVERLEGTGLLHGHQTVEVFQVVGEHLERPLTGRRSKAN